MIDVLADKFPDITGIIHYEDVIADPAAALDIAAELCGLAGPSGPLPDLGDDRGCAARYLELMAKALKDPDGG